jgi:hypothetical protein
MTRAAARTPQEDKMKLIFPAMQIASLFAGCSAYAGDVWTCTYPGYGDNAPVTMRYVENGDYFEEQKYGLKYRTLQNNEYALIATWIVSGIEPGNKHPSIGAATIVINKATGDFLRENANIAGPDSVNAPVRGKCLKD